MAEYWPEGTDWGWSEEFYGEEGFDSEEEFLAEDWGNEELWLYQTALDERVCGQCAPLEGVLFSADDIAEQFPAAEDFQDIIFVNLHDRCRCQLIKQPGTEPANEGGEEDTVEGRGTPLSSRAPGFIRLMRHPTQYGAARFGIRSTLVMLGASWLIFPILGLLLPLVMSAMQVWTQKQIEIEIAKAMEEERKKREALLREAYRGIIPE